MDRPDEVRRQLNFKRLSMTDFKVEIPRLAKKAVLAKALAEADVFAKFGKSAWGAKLASRAAKAATTDFDRYTAMVSKIKRSAKVRRSAPLGRGGAGVAGGGRGGDVAEWGCSLSWLGAQETAGVERGEELEAGRRTGEQHWSASQTRLAGWARRRRVQAAGWRACGRALG